MARNIEEIRADIATWRERKFMNQMADRWSSDDYAYDRLCHEKLVELEGELLEAERESHE